MTNQPKAAFDFNPFFVYVVAFLLPGLLYQLDWSYLYPDLSAGLLIFLLIMSIKGVLSFIIKTYGYSILNGY
jgi:hypothetical protein